MKRIVIFGWHIGFNKVGMSKLLRREFQFSLPDAHSFVDDILNGKVYELDVSEESSSAVAEELRSLGLKFELIDRPEAP